MIFSHQTLEWVVLNREERKWFARMLIEALFWVHGSNSLGTIEKYTSIEAAENSEDLKLFNDTGIEIFDQLSLRDRDLVLWHCFKCACYPNVKANSSILEAGIIAMIRILYWQVQSEIDHVNDAWSYVHFAERPGFIATYTRYRILFETIYRYLVHSNFEGYLSDTKVLANGVLIRLLQKIEEVDLDLEECRELPPEIRERDLREVLREYEVDYHEELKVLPSYQKLYRKLYPLNPPDFQWAFEQENEWFWKERLSRIEYTFTTGDYEYELSHQEARDRGLKPAYYNVKQTLRRIDKNKSYGYWDLLFACLNEQPIPNYFKLEKKPYRQSWYETIEQDLPSSDFAWLQENIITSDYVIGNHPVKFVIN